MEVYVLIRTGTGEFCGVFKTYERAQKEIDDNPHIEDFQIQGEEVTE